MLAFSRRTVVCWAQKKGGERKNVYIKSGFKFFLWIVVDGLNFGVVGGLMGVVVLLLVVFQLWLCSSLYVFVVYIGWILDVVSVLLSFVRKWVQFSNSLFVAGVTLLRSVWFVDFVVRLKLSLDCGMTLTGLSLLLLFFFFFVAAALPPQRV